MTEETKTAARLLGSRGGKARAKNLTAKRRSEIARQAVAAREEKRRNDKAKRISTKT